MSTCPRPRRGCRHAPLFDGGPSAYALASRPLEFRELRSACFFRSRAPGNRSLHVAPARLTLAPAPSSAAAARRCALPPQARRAWAEAWGRHLAPGGTLVTLIFPVDPAADPNAGPPFPVTPELYEGLLLPAGGWGRQLERLGRCVLMNVARVGRARGCAQRWSRRLCAAIKTVPKARPLTCACFPLALPPHPTHLSHPQALSASSWSRCRRISATRSAPAASG